MNCIAFPKMFSGNSTIIISGEKNSRDATYECMKLLLESEAGSMFGDPDYGIKLRYFTFNQNDYVLKDILIDEIYTKLIAFCPQLILDRNNIVIEQNGSIMSISITAKNKIDFVTNTYNLQLKMEDKE